MQVVSYHTCSKMPICDDHPRNNTKDHPNNSQTCARLTTHTYIFSETSFYDTNIQSHSRVYHLAHCSYSSAQWKKGVNAKRYFVYQMSHFEGSSNMTHSLISSRSLRQFHSFDPRGVKLVQPVRKTPKQNTFPTVTSKILWYTRLLQGSDPSYACRLGPH